MLPSLTIVPAGAGSGKTYTIQQWLGEWVKQGKVQPERIVAVTFTEAAAAELRERIRTKLLDDGQLEAALRLDQAYISTIHGFGLRLLTEFAFDAGLSPQPRLLNEDEQNTLVRQALARTDKADAIASNLAQYGYAYEYNTGKSAEDVFRDMLLDLVSQLRSAGWKEESSHHKEQAVEWIQSRYGKTGDGVEYTKRLIKASKNLLNQFPESIAPQAPSKAAFNDLQRDFRNFNRASKTDALNNDWKLWKELRSARVSNSRFKLPKGYDELAEAVVDAANALPQHPGALEHAIRHIDALLAAGQDVLVHYAQAKREAGLVDFSDMIAMAGEVLRERPEVLETLVERIDCLVVDEFQDTNPLQFALLWQLKEAGVPTVIVGDLKQAIMGFQGADPRLFDAIIRRYPEACDPLERNWRSQSKLMDFVNAIGPGLFGQDYVSLKPQLGESVLEPLEAIDYPVKAKKGYHAVRAAAVGQRLQALLNDSTQQVVDKRSRVLRSLRGGDIAVLCPTNNMLGEYATVLRSMGFTVKIQEQGWYESRAVQLSLNALAYVANPQDRHAALYLAVTELGSLTLESALNQLIDKAAISDPLLDKLDQLASGTAEYTLYALVSDTLNTLEFFDVVAAWPDAEQSRANLLRLVAEAGEFMDANREALARGGFYGAGVQSFLAWLDKKVEHKDQDDQPDPRVLNEDAVELVSWHRSKGREWPVVVVSGMDRVIKASLPSMGLGYRSFDDLSRLFECAQIEFSPKFFAQETDDNFLAELQSASEIETRRLLYVAMTRPKDKLILEWPSYLEGKDSLTYWSGLVEQTGLSMESDALVIGEKSFSCTVTKGDSELPDDLDLESQEMPIILPVTGRRAIRSGTVLRRLTPDNVTPSGLVIEEQGAAGVGSIVEVFQYGNGLEIDLDLVATERGTFLHRCFEVLGANPALMGRLLVSTGIELDEESSQSVANSVADFETWMYSHFSSKSIARELPILALGEQGSVVSGIVDLVLRTENGIWIIDHKSDQIDDPEEAFNSYRPQLEAYVYSLSSAGEKVLGIGINWIHSGVVVLSRL